MISGYVCCIDRKVASHRPNDLYSVSLVADSADDDSNTRLCLKSSLLLTLSPSKLGREHLGSRYATRLLI